MVYWLVFMATMVTLNVINTGTKVNDVTNSFGLRAFLICFASTVNTGAFWLLSSLFGL